MIDQDKNILTMLVDNAPGVMARISGLFAGRGYNIETISSAPTADPKISRITIMTKATPLQLEQCMKQIKRLVNVIKLRDMTGKIAIKREMALICVNHTPETRKTLDQAIAAFEIKILDSTDDSLTFEVNGDQNTIDILIDVLKPFGIKKMARSGIMTLYKESELQ
ncbi:MAG: acetolactate synthase small subunit [Pseudomonadota bacterium]